MRKTILKINGNIGNIFGLLYFVMCASCEQEKDSDYNIAVNDPNLSLELIARDPDIVTPIGMAFDDKDALYILESHTHTPAKDYQGPKFDRIKKSIDSNKDGIPEGWTVFADSIEDGMNLAYGNDYGLFLTTKNGVYRYSDDNGDGKSDSKETLVQMTEPDNVYDHAAILGLAIGNDGYLYFSRGNVGGVNWVVRGSDGSEMAGYGDGGNVMRCRIDGSGVEEVATGFWNPFDLKFDTEGRLFATDNDPDSRGPNRLVEIVPGGDYGYKSLYGGSGIHPYQSWNGELPGTLPYAAPLGEAPCGMIDAGFTNFGDLYSSKMFVNIWEENNIVSIPLKTKQSTVKGNPEVLIQGDSLFHPVAFAINSKGDLYLTDWVIRRYPNHGNGRIWRLSTKNGGTAFAKGIKESKRFKPEKRTIAELIDVLAQDDPFECTLARYYLAKRAETSELLSILQDSNAQLRLQALLVFFNRDEHLKKQELSSLLSDKNLDVKRMVLVYIGEMGLTDMLPNLIGMIKGSRIEPELFETFLATIRHLQPAFIEGYTAKKGKSSDVPRELPESFIINILADPNIDEIVKSMALPYLNDIASREELLLRLLKNAKDQTLQTTMVTAIGQLRSEKVDETLKMIALDPDFSAMARALALSESSYRPIKFFDEVQVLLQNESDVLQYAALKYICISPHGSAARAKAGEWVQDNMNKVSKTALAVWNACNGNVGKPSSDTEWRQAVNNNGDYRTGQLVYGNKGSLCITCHKINGWGGFIGPDLTKIGSSKNQQQLVNAILEPSKEIAPEWQGWYVVDKEGTQHTGRQIDVHLDGVELMDTYGNFVGFDHPRSYGVMESSVMPEALENTMNAAEFNDLIAYLTSLK